VSSGLLVIWCFSTSGVPFESRPIHVLIPAISVHQVVLSGKALQPGTLTLRGCYAQAPGGNRREFILPISTDDEEEQLSRKKSMLACEVGRLKYSGIESFPWEKEKRRVRMQSASTTAAKSFRFLECKVVPEQPLLRIRRTSVTHSAVMLYDGETYEFDCCCIKCMLITFRSSIRITLENVSRLPIDFLRLVFDDSTIIPAQQALAEGTLSAFDTYETEHSLIHNPVLSWDQRDTNSIPPGQKLTVNVKCIGKVGW
jgi:trafficking protein particle complex subunit 9